ncbi:MAG: hypothetical protein AAFX76_07395 [Planctomycetota bacterium]
MALTVAAGCQSAPKVDQRLLDYRSAMGSATESIQASEFDGARGHIDTALRLAQDEVERQKAQSLGHLVDGTEAYAQGDVLGAKSKWEQISDPVLYREVRRKARVLGVSLPLQQRVGRADSNPESES